MHKQYLIIIYLIYHRPKFSASLTSGKWKNFIALLILCRTEKVRCKHEHVFFYFLFIPLYFKFVHVFPSKKQGWTETYCRFEDLKSTTYKICNKDVMFCNVWYETVDQVSISMWYCCCNYTLKIMRSCYKIQNMDLI